MYIQITQLSDYLFTKSHWYMNMHLKSHIIIFIMCPKIHTVLSICIFKLLKLYKNLFTKSHAFVDMYLQSHLVILTCIYKLTQLYKYVGGGVNKNM